MGQPGLMLQRPWPRSAGRARGPARGAAPATARAAPRRRLAPRLGATGQDRVPIPYTRTGCGARSAAPATSAASRRHRPRLPRMGRSGARSRRGLSDSHAYGSSTSSRIEAGANASTCSAWDHTRPGGVSRPARRLQSRPRDRRPAGRRPRAAWSRSPVRGRADRARNSVATSACVGSPRRAATLAPEGRGAAHREAVHHVHAPQQRRRGVGLREDGDLHARARWRRQPRAAALSRSAAAHLPCPPAQTASCTRPRSPAAHKLRCVPQRSIASCESHHTPGRCRLAVNLRSYA